MTIKANCRRRQMERRSNWQSAWVTRALSLGWDGMGMELRLGLAMPPKLQAQPEQEQLRPKPKPFANVLNGNGDWDWEWAVELGAMSQVGAIWVCRKCEQLLAQELWPSGFHQGIWSIYGCRECSSSCLISRLL